MFASHGLMWASVYGRMLRTEHRPLPAGLVSRKAGFVLSIVLAYAGVVVLGLKVNLLTSGLYFYLYNELSTITIKKTSATTMSVANTAKRVIVIVGVAIALGESLEPIKLLGCSIGIGGVLLYSLVK